VNTGAAASKVIRSTIPARLDRLSWSPFHTRMVAGLGAAWILDGLQITISSSVTGQLVKPSTLGMSSTEIGLIASIYLVGEVVGALVFGRLSDKLGRKRLLIVTLLLYLFGTGLAAFVTGHHTGWLLFFYATRFVAGMGIGGQYAAINSAIDEMMPAKYRGRVDIWINGTYWAGAILGSFASLIFLNAFAVNVGWRLAFLMGPVLALVVLVVGRTLPESPRWLMTHGRVEEAEREIKKIEDAARKSGQTLEPVPDSEALELTPETEYGYVMFLGLVFRKYPKRAVLGASLMITQSFLYNAIFFTYALVLVKLVLRRERHQGAPLRSRVLDRQLDRATRAGAALRHGGPEEDDFGYLHPVRRSAGRQRLALRQQRPHRELADIRVGRHLLLRVGRGERGLPHGQRDLADRDPRRGDRSVLRHRPGRRSVRPAVLWMADRRRHGQDGTLHRLSRRCRDHDPRRGDRDHFRDQRRRQIPRGRHRATHLRHRRGEA
jgi:MFS family permease